MKRRDFIKVLAFGAGASSLPVTQSVLAAASSSGSQFEVVKDSIMKSRDFDRHFSDDIVLRGVAYKRLTSVVARLKRLQRLVGYANFSLISFDQALYYARNYSKVGEFPKAEIEFLEAIFYTNASNYGFFGEKPLNKITDHLVKRDLIKIRGTGHYVFRSDSLTLYKKIRKDVGSSIILTSGVRGIVKQMHLFLNKAIASKGNLSMASRSLAPPGHSFHGVGDFDVGKHGYGSRNFSEDFAKTDEFKRLSDLGYVDIRYPPENKLGVRFEPWHIKVIV